MKSLHIIFIFFLEIEKNDHWVKVIYILFKMKITNCNKKTLSIVKITFSDKVVKLSYHEMHLIILTYMVVKP